MNHKNLARAAGLLYLFIIIFAGFSEGVVRADLIVNGDAAATAANIKNSEFLWRLGFVFDLLAFIFDLGVSVLLYILLKDVNKTIALAASSLRLIAHPAIAAVNLLNFFLAIPILNSSEMSSAFSAEQVNALILTFTELHGIGYLMGGVFFGFHFIFLGYLLYKSDLFPNWLAVLMFPAAFGYLIESFGIFLFPQYGEFYSAIVLVTAIAGELALCFWLLIKGVKAK